MILAMPGKYFPFPVSSLKYLVVEVLLSHVISYRKVGTLPGLSVESHAGVMEAVYVYFMVIFSITLAAIPAKHVYMAPKCLDVDGSVQVVKWSPYIYVYALCPHLGTMGCTI